VPCQDICKGPVAGVELDGEVHWFAKVRKGRHRRALRAVIEGPATPLPEPLAGREVARRRGRLKRPKPGWGRS
jgi:hypothetical protein